jgi:hypothetical protein
LKNGGIGFLKVEASDFCHELQRFAGCREKQPAIIG